MDREQAEVSSDPSSVISGRVISDRELRWVVCVVVTVVLFVLAGCTQPRPQKGGRGKTPNGEIVQGDNASTPSSQNFERTERVTIPLPAGTVIGDQSSVIRPRDGKDLKDAKVFKKLPPTKKNHEGQRVPQFPGDVAALPGITLAGPSVFTIERTERNGTVLGAAQKDTARELAVKIGGLRPVMWFGIACVLGGAVLAYFSWWSMAVLSWVIGGAAIILAAVLPGHELWFIGGGAVILGISLPWMLHLYNAGRLDKYLPDSLDKNHPNLTAKNAENTKSDPISTNEGGKA